MIERLGLTPGPWVVSKINSGAIGVVSRFKDGRRYTDICESSVGFMGNTKDLELISASHDMLELLIDMYDDWKYVDMYANAVKELVEKATGKKWEKIKEAIR